MLLMQGANAQFKGAAEATVIFSTESGTFFDPVASEYLKGGPSGHGLWGMALGAAMMTIFFVYVAIMIINDEMTRTKFYEERVGRYNRKLSDKYGLKGSELQDLADTFRIKDQGEGRKKDDDE